MVRIFDVGGLALPAELRKGATPRVDAVAWICQRCQCLPAIASLAEIERTLERCLIPLEGGAVLRHAVASRLL